MSYVFDTNIILISLKDQRMKEFLKKNYSIFEKETRAIISIVTLGELDSISKQNNWGEKRIRAMEKFLDDFLVVDVRFEKIVELYGNIDAFSNGKLEGKPLGMTARNMGKNDLWIAATAALTNSKLITTDKDFSHLDKVFFDLELLERF